MSDSKRLSPEDRQELVAFLDGELESGVTDRLEHTIANSVAARREVETLRQTWELLDFLDLPDASPDFTRQTVEMIASDDLRKEAAAEKVSRAVRQVFVAVSVLAGLAGCFTVGWAVTRYWPDPNRRLIEELPIVERYEEYRAVGEIEFLSQLDKKRLLDLAEEPVGPELLPESTR